MPKYTHEFRDPIHVFINVDTEERKVIDSRPLQRLRNIHQLALTYLVYPGATHRRFEHALGVMELATRVFDVVTRPENVSDPVRNLVSEISDEGKKPYWRRVLRMAALCHDIGHLPFSHAAEKELLPDGWDHERLTKDIVLSDEMRSIWDEMTPPIRATDIAKLAVGAKKYGEALSTWEALLSEIVVGDAFGVDRIDYLLRDSHHTGVAYGRFDHYRLIDTLRVLRDPASEEPVIGVEFGGVHSAEALLLARFFMFSQVYYHKIRVIYDLHLREFLSAWLEGGRFPTDIESHLKWTDVEAMAAMIEAAGEPEKPGHDPAARIVNRNHFRLLYSRNPQDQKINLDATKAIFAAALERFGLDSVRSMQRIDKKSTADFPVRMDDGSVQSSIEVSDTLANIPITKAEFVYIAPELLDDARQWLKENKGEVIKKTAGGIEDEA